MPAAAKTKAPPAKDPLDVILSLDALNLPKRPRVVAVEHEPYVDNQGKDTLRIRAVLADDTPGKDRTWAKVKPIRDAIVDAILGAKVDLFPYISYPTRAELRSGRHTR